MKIEINVDMSPEELRRLMGLPDVQEFNQEVMKHMLNKVKSGSEEYDPVAFFKSSIIGNANAADTFKHWMDAFNRIANAGHENTGKGKAEPKS